MLPHSSRVLSTTLSGLGLGLIAWLGFGVGGQSPLFALIAGALAVAATLSGLILGPSPATRPRDWAETVAAWGRSWSSRAGLLALLAVAAFAVYLVLWIVLGWRFTLLGLTATAAAVVAVYSTGMTYRTAPDAPMWNTILTPTTFVAFALASGALCDAMLTDLVSHDDGGRADGAAVFLLLIAFAFRLSWWNRARALKKDSDALTEAPVETPFWTGRMTTLRRAAIGLGLAAPIVCIDLSSRFGAFFVLIGLGSHVAGLMIERWLFLSAEPEAEPSEARLDTP
jgi:Ni/Fe-hydrogenase subunit HybB-like protein